MATELSRLFVSVGADIGDLERKMAKAAASVNGLTKAQQAAANNPALQNALVKMGAVAATAGTAIAGVTQETRAMTLTHMRAIAMNDAMGKASAGAAMNVGKMSGAFRVLALQATGVSPALGRVGDALGAFAFGAGPMAAVLLGLAAVATAWELITKKSREAQKAQDEAVTAARAIGLEQKQGLQGGSLATLQGVNAALAQANNELVELENAAKGIATTSATMAAKMVLPWFNLGDEIKKTKGLVKEMVSLQSAMNSKMETAEKDHNEKMMSEAEKAEAERLAHQKRMAQLRMELLDQELARRGVAMQKLFSLGASGALGGGPRSVGSIPRAPGQEGGDQIGPIGLPSEAGLEEVRGPARNLRELGSQVAGAGSIGEMASAVGSSFGMLAKTALPLAALFEVFSGIMKPLQPVIEMLKAPLQRLGEIIGKALVPAIMFAGDVIFKVAGGIAIGVGKIISGIFGVLSKIPLIGNLFKPLRNFGNDLVELGQDMWNWQEAFATGAEDATDAINQFASAVHNEASGFKINQARFNATQGRALPTAQAGVVISGPIYVTSPDPKETLKEIEREAMRKANRGGSGLTLGYAG